MYSVCDYTLLWPIQPFPLLSLTPSLLPNPPLFDSFQYISLCPLPSQMLFYVIVDALSLFLSRLPQEGEEFVILELLP
jgi:hypothetical protein